MRPAYEYVGRRRRTMALSSDQPHRMERWTCGPEGVVRDRVTQVEVRFEEVSIEETDEGVPYGNNLST